MTLHTKLTSKLVAVIAAVVAIGTLSSVGAIGAGASAGAGALVPSTSTTIVGTTARGTSGQPALTSVPTTTVGTCHGLTGLASVKSDYTDPNDGLPAGLVANLPTAGANHDVRISVKGVANAAGSFGTCTFSGDNTPGAGTYHVEKWTALLVSPATDCLADSDSSETSNSAC